MLYHDIAWELANCAGTDTTQFFSSHKNIPPNPMVYRICDACEIQPECLAWALQQGEYGVWGGQYFKDKDVLNGDGAEVHTGNHGDGVSEVWSGDQ